MQVMYYRLLRNFNFIKHFCFHYKDQLVNVFQQNNRCLQLETYKPINSKWSAADD
jgi:hypothetical protein